MTEHLHLGTNVPSKNGQDWHENSCWGCGAGNPNGLHASFDFDEASGEVRFTYTPSEWQEGAPGFVHGGILASLLDEAQGVLCFHIGHMVMTDQLQLKYHQATLVTRPFQVRCWITAARKRRLYTRAEVSGMDGKLLVSSRGVWYVLPERLMRRLFGERFPDGEAERMRKLLEANRKRAREIRKRLRGSKAVEN